jgi:membrane protease YdiL (CAAX protease family)
MSSLIHTDNIDPEPPSLARINPGTGGARDLVQRHPVVAFFALAYTFSWLAWAPLVVSALGWAEGPPGWWHYVGSAGPIAAACVIAASAKGGVTHLARQLHPARVAPRWWLFAFGTPIALFVAGSAAGVAAGAPMPGLEAVAKTHNLPALGLLATWLVHLGTFGIGEETGWRGFALPRLQARLSPLRATLVLAAAWGVWHLPTFIYNPQFVALGPVGLVGWSLGLVAGAVFFTWLFNATRGGLAAVVLWHATFNTLIASEAATETVSAVMTAGVMVAAVALVIVRPEPLRAAASAVRHREPIRE